MVNHNSEQESARVRQYLLYEIANPTQEPYMFPKPWYMACGYNDAAIASFIRKDLEEFSARVHKTVEEMERVVTVGSRS